MGDRIDGAHRCDASFGQSDYGLHQSWGDRQNVPGRQSSRGTGGKPASRAFANANCPLMSWYITSSRWRCIMHVVVSRSAALSAGRCPVAEWLAGADQGGGQVGHFASAHAAGMGDRCANCMTSGAADRDAVDQGRLVSALAAGQPRRQHAGCRRRARARGRPSAGRAQPRRQRLSANPLRLSGGERHARLVRQRKWRAMRPARSPWPQHVLPALQRGHVVFGGSNFFGFELWNQAPAPPAPICSGGSRRTLRLPCEQRLPDGSYLSRIYPSDKDRRQGTNGVKVRVIEYSLEGVADAEPIYRLVTTILDPTRRPPRNWRRSITSAGRSKPRSTN